MPLSRSTTTSPTTCIVPGYPGTMQVVIDGDGSFTIAKGGCETSLARGETCGVFVQFLPVVATVRQAWLLRLSGKSRRDLCSVARCCSTSGYKESRTKLAPSRLRAIQIQRACRPLRERQAYLAYRALFSLGYQSGMSNRRRLTTCGAALPISNNCGLEQGLAGRIG